MRTKSHTFTQSQLGLVMLANRRGSASTELFLRVTAQILPDQFCTPLHASRGPRIGFLHFTLASTEEVGGRHDRNVRTISTARGRLSMPRSSSRIVRCFMESAGSPRSA